MICFSMTPGYPVIIYNTLTPRAITNMPYITDTDRHTHTHTHTHTHIPTIMQVLVLVYNN